MYIVLYRPVPVPVPAPVHYSQYRTIAVPPPSLHYRLHYVWWDRLDSQHFRHDFTAASRRLHRASQKLHATSQKLKNFTR